MVFKVLLRFNTGLPDGEWLEVEGDSISELIQNCVDSMYDSTLDGYMEVLEIKECD